MHDKHYQVRTDATTSTSFKKIAFYYMLNIGASKLDFPASISFPHGSQTQSVQKKDPGDGGTIEYSPECRQKILVLRATFVAFRSVKGSNKLNSSVLAKQTLLRDL